MQWVRHIGTTDVHALAASAGEGAPAGRGTMRRAE